MATGHTPTYQSLLDAAKAIVGEHNAQNPTPLLDWTKTETRIKSQGGTTIEALRQATWEDLQDCGIPRILARRITAVFRDTSATDTATTKVLKPSQVAAMTFAELFSHYDPTSERYPVVAARLKEEAAGRKCVVFNADNTVNVEQSTRLLRELKDGFPETEKTTVGGRVYRVWRVGETPNLYFNENPLYPGQPLRSGEVCDKTNRSWVGIDPAIRQLVYLAVKNTREIAINSVDDAHRVLDMLSQPDAADKLAARYSTAALLLQDLTARQQAPSLLIPRNGSSQKPNDPFTAHKKY